LCAAKYSGETLLNSLLDIVAEKHIRIEENDDPLHIPTLESLSMFLIDNIISRIGLKVNELEDNVQKLETDLNKMASVIDVMNGD
jgi:hypothetical protein